MGIPANEFFLKEIITTRLTQLSDNPKLLDRIFVNHGGIIPRLKEFLNTPERLPKVMLGFPREPSQLPCYVVILGQSTQQAAGLGMNFDVEYPDYSEEITDFEETLTPVVDSEDVDEGIYIQTSEIISFVKSITQNGEEVLYNVVHTEKGIIQLFDIDPNSPVKIIYDYPNKVFKTRGALFNDTYRIECWSNNGDLTAYMFLILKWILLSAIEYLTENGFILPTLNGQDFEPVPDYFPEFVYRRSLNVQTQIENSWEQWDEALSLRGIKFNIDEMENGN